VIETIHGFLLSKMGFIYLTPLGGQAGFCCVALLLLLVVVNVVEGLSALSCGSVYGFASGRSAESGPVREPKNVEVIDSSVDSEIKFPVLPVLSIGFGRDHWIDMVGSWIESQPTRLKRLRFLIWKHSSCSGGIGNLSSEVRKRWRLERGELFKLNHSYCVAGNSLSYIYLNDIEGYGLSWYNFNLIDLWLYFNPSALILTDLPLRYVVSHIGFLQSSVRIVVLLRSIPLRLSQLADGDNDDTQSQEGIKPDTPSRSLFPYRFFALGGIVLFSVSFVCLNKALEIGTDRGDRLLYFGWLIGASGVLIFLMAVI
jgi:hypothetical protein